MTKDRQAAKRSRVKADRDRINREMSAGKAAAGVKYIEARIPPVVLAARLAEIPPDTRTLTQRMFGDPLPGRDALSRRGL